MDEIEVPKPKRKKFTGLSERDKSLLLLLREIPFITMNEVKANFYPSHKYLSYAKDKMRFLMKEKLITKRFLENGKYIYFLTPIGIETAEYLKSGTPRFDIDTATFYFQRPPFKKPESEAFFLFPSLTIEYQKFTSDTNPSFTYLHSQALLELYFQIYRARRFKSIIWLDKVKNKKACLDLDCNPDLLFTNDLYSSEGRVLIELENSEIRGQNLHAKIENLSKQHAEDIILLATNEEIFKNLGHKIRNMIVGNINGVKERVFLSQRALAVLNQSLWIGVWTPAIKNNNVQTKIRGITLYRYDDEIFDYLVWTDRIEKEFPSKEKNPKKGKKVLISQPFPNRKPGIRSILFSDLLNKYTGDFKKSMAPFFPSENIRKVG